MARALVNRPKVLLLDEPLSALDLKLRQEMQVELRAIQKRLRITFIFVTHDQEEALSLSDRIAVMNAGNVEQVGTPREIYEHPKSEFVAGFIGSINSIEAFVQSEATSSLEETGKLQAVNAQGSIFSIASAQVSFPWVAGERIKLMVRPEKMRLSKNTAKNGALTTNQVSGQLKEVIYQGPLTRFLVQLQDGALLSVIQSNFFESVRDPLIEGDQVIASWASEDCVVMRRQEFMPSGVGNAGAL